MQVDRWKRVEELFQAAMAQPREKRIEFLAHACRGDPQLRSKVESLVEVADGATSFLEGSPLSSIGELQPALISGQKLGNFEILEPIGRGGMGEVYRARDLRLQREVALKVLARDVTDGERQRFLREAQAASALNHPNIVTIHEVGEQDGVSYIAMEFLGGTTLHNLIPSQGMSLSDALGIAEQLAGAMAAAHSANIVHRDLKPSNVIVTESGVVKVLDFGLAKRSGIQGSEQPQTEPGTIIGTVGYMSPEQAQGRPVDTRSDIFSFGSILYEMLSGKRAFQGDSKMATLAFIIRDEPSPLRTSLPAELRNIVSRCLNKERDRRYQHMGDVRLALQELRRPDSVRRRRLLIVAAIVLLAVFAGYWRFKAAFTQALSPPEVVPLTSNIGELRGAKLSPDGSQAVFSWNGEHEDNYDIYLKLVGSSTQVRLTTDPALDQSPAFSRDGRSIGFIRTLKNTDHSLFMLIPAIGGPERTVAEIPGTDHFDWLPDGKRVVLDGLRLLSIETGELSWLTHPAPELLEIDSTPAVSPDGRTVAFSRGIGSGRSEIFLLYLGDDLQPRSAPRQLTRLNQMCNSPTWTSDGRHIVFLTVLGTKGGLWRVAVSGSAAPEPVAFGQGEIIGDLTVASHGQRLAYTRYLHDTNIWRLPLASTGIAGGSPARFISSSRDEYAPRYSPDGKQIAFESNRSGNWGIWVADSSGSSVWELPLRTGALHVGSPSWSTDAQRIAFDAAPDLYVASARGGESQRLTNGAKSAMNMMPDWSRDGKWLYFTVAKRGDQPLGSAADRGPHLCNIWRKPAAGGDAEQLTRNGGDGSRLSPDGKSIYYTIRENDISGLWKKAAWGGGDEIMVLPSVYWRSFDVVEKGIYFIPGSDENGKYSIQFLNFSTGKVRTVAPISARPFAGFDVSPDGRFLLYTQEDRSGADLMLVENFQ